MYWKRHQIPAPDWHAEAVIEQLTPFQGCVTRPPTPVEMAYCRFYGLDLELDFERVTHRLGYVTAAGYRVAVHYYCQPDARGTVLAMHGYFDHAGLYVQLFERLLASGYNVLCYDQPGHGLSSGERAGIQSFEDYQRVLHDVLQSGGSAWLAVEPWFAVGQSTGGAVLLDYLLRQPAAGGVFQNVVLLAPLVRPAGWQVSRLLHWAIKPFFTTWQRVFTENSGNGAFVRFLREHDPLQPRAMAVSWVTALKEWIARIEAAPGSDFPLTVIQGELDKTVDWPHNLAVIKQKFPHCRVLMLPAGRHHLANETPSQLTRLLDWVCQGLQREK